MACRFEQSKTGGNSASRVCVAGQGRDEHPDDLVSNELVHDRVVVDQDARRCVVETIEDVAELGWAHLLGQGGRPAHIGEQKAGLDLGSAVMCLELLEAVSAVLGIFRPAFPADEAHEMSPRAAKGSRAHLAARMAWHVLQPGACPRIPRLSAEEDRSPQPLVRSWGLLARRGRPLARCGRRRHAIDAH